MEAKELRINNFIRLKENGNIFDVKVVGTRCEAIDVYNNGVYTSYFKNIDDYLEPIPLTEEWLLKFGFIKECDWKISIGEGAFIWIDENDFTVAIGIPYEASGNQRTMKHVNQLQNLYFALTGEELTIKK